MEAMVALLRPVGRQRSRAANADHALAWREPLRPLVRPASHLPARLQRAALAGAIAKKLGERLFVVGHHGFQHGPRRAGYGQQRGHGTGATARHGEHTAARGSVDRLDQPVGGGVHRHSIVILARSGLASGYFMSRPRRALTIVSATTRLRYHLWFAGTMCQDAHGVLHRLKAA